MIKYSPYTSNIIALHGIDYFFSDIHISAVRDSKRLAFNDTTQVLSLSLNNGSTYPITLNLTGVCSIITRAEFYANGNISWSDQTKCYYSTDNLATYHEATVLGIDGNAFTASSYDNFEPFDKHKPVVVNGTEIDIWGCYSIEAGTQYDNINVWMTIDSGVTIKSIFKAGVTLGIGFRHCEFTTWNPIDNTLWFSTGDSAKPPDYLPDCYIIKGSNVWDDALRSFTIVAGPSSMLDINHITGLAFFDQYAFFGTEMGTNNGIYRCLYTDLDKLDTPAKSTKVEPVLGYCAILHYWDESGLIIASGYEHADAGEGYHIYWSSDKGVTWTDEYLIGGPELSSDLGMVFGFGQRANDGYMRADIVTPYGVNQIIYGLLEQS